MKIKICFGCPNVNLRSIIMLSRWYERTTLATLFKSRKSCNFHIILKNLEKALGNSCIISLPMQVQFFLNDFNVTFSYTFNALALDIASNEYKLQVLNGGTLLPKLKFGNPIVNVLNLPINIACKY